MCRISAELICKLHAKNFQFFLTKNSDNPSYPTVVPAVHLFSNTYPTHASLLQSINDGNNVGSSYDV